MKVTRPCEFVTPWSPNDEIATFTPCTGLPWPLTTLMEIVTLAGGTVIPEVEVAAVVAVSAVVEVHTVDTTVVVAEKTPPKGENRRIVDNGVL